jgi:hypothetical protein
MKKNTMSKRRLSVVLAAMVLVLSVGCSSNLTSTHLLTKNEDYLTHMRDREFEFWSAKIKARRLKFESDIDWYVVKTLKQAEKTDVLTAEGVGAMMRIEGELRAKFNASEEASLKALSSRLASYENLANLNRAGLRKIAEQDIAMAAKVRQLAEDLEDDIQRLAFASMIRRQQMVEDSPDVSPTEEIHEPPVEAVEVPTATTVDSPPPPGV